MANRRSLSVSVENEIASFQSKIHCGPEYVCMSCHRMMYRQSVVECDKDKYTKTSKDILEKVFSLEHKRVSPNGKLYVCKACHSALSRSNMPLHSKANGLELSPIPLELSSLNELEARLIPLRVPFMKMVALPCGKQRSIRGPAVNVPTKIDNICRVLPRLPSQSKLIPLKLKRKLVYKGHYMYGYVTPEKLLNALKRLKANNPLYANIVINNDWVEEALNNDPDLLIGLIQQHDAFDEHNDMQPEPDSMECESGPQNIVSGSIQPNSAMCNTTVNVRSQEHSNDMDVDDSHDLHVPCVENDDEHAFGFQIHDVSTNGDCLYNAVLCQYQRVSVMHSQARNPEVISQFVHKDKAYQFLKNVRDSPSYYQRTFYELLAMIRQLGTPTWLFTLSAADMKWPDMIKTIARQYGVTYTDEEVASLAFEEKSNWLKCNPVTAARQFQYMLNTFFQEFLQSTAKPLGEIEDYGIRIEFQSRGSPHAHCLIRVKGAPKYAVNDNA